MHSQYFSAPSLNKTEVLPCNIVERGREGGLPTFVPFLLCGQRFSEPVSTHRLINITLRYIALRVVMPQHEC